MTSEVCLMNRLGIVLAADSATTVKYWNGDVEEVRYFKGANKIFQLSNEHPVGVMIYNAVDVLRVPWEVVIKEFRKELGSKSFNSVKGYADEFISFLNNDTRMFPASVRRQEFEDSIRRAALRIHVLAKDAIKEGSVADFAIFLERLTAAGKLADPSEFGHSAEEIAALRQGFGEVIQKHLDDWASVFGHALHSLDEAELQFVLVAALREVTSSGNWTGLVFSGFGDHSIYPECVHMQECQFVANKLIFRGIVEDKTSYDVPAVISGFAQTSMIDTLRIGFSDDVMEPLYEDTKRTYADLVDQVADMLGQSVPDDKKSEMTNAAVQSIIDRMFDRAFKNHSLPLRRVVGVLPLDEMSALAETLINLQSLKEKVTRPTETVGGPVDVAVITRAEGLVWVKRKHYFDGNLNSRFFERRRRD